MAKRGPPKKVTPDIKREFLEYLRVGMSLADAYEAVDMDRKTIQAAAREDEAFSHGIKTNCKRGKGLHLKRIFQAKAGWQASAWCLERKDWQEFAQRRPDSVSPDDFAEFAVMMAELVRKHMPEERMEAFFADYRALMQELRNAKKN